LVNVVVVSGTVGRKFDKRETKEGKPFQSASLEQTLNGRTSRFNLSAFGEYALKELDSVVEGDKVIVQGRLSESRYKKDDQWVSKYEISIQKIEAVAPSARTIQEGDHGGYEPVAAGAYNEDDVPF
jgi:single-stranded DNA-binding protein